MPIFQRQDIAKLLSRIGAGEIAPVYLLVGERYLCREMARQLVAALLPEEGERPSRLTVIDGEREDPARTLAELRTYSLFGGRRVHQVVDSRLLFSKTVAKTLWEKAEKAAENEKKEAVRLLLAMLGLAGLTPAAWRQEQIAGLAAGAWQKLFGFTKPADTSWAEAILAEIDDQPAPAPTGAGDTAEAYVAALENGLPPGNILLLLAETADRRKKLYKYLEKNAVIIDLSVDGGRSAPARREQKELLADLARRTLAGFGKKLAADALEPLLERIGFHPVAVVMETEKLALYVGERTMVGREDVDAMVGRTREEAIFELSEAYSSGKLEQGLLLLERLQRGGMHPLAILGGLRNHIRKLLLTRAVIDGATTAFNPGTPFPAFQKNYLPRLKEERERGRGWPAAFTGHPYALYQLCLQATRLPPARLRGMLADLLRAEARLKGSGLPAATVMSALFLGGNSHP
ncbi:MAG TPA: DNA polymerase III subunit delta [Desulfurivibrio alkaliphilus]|uniref:DNA-directed DNA polymerase n=1 Tax=Desulfurivibrio alkaliphilus TaxID=427923 RepID=A0A7C2TF82_9BACT|nr:DNA polymerase III subunit delta [Desulfurivibrio alkaliphilus]